MAEAAKERAPAEHALEQMDDEEVAAKEAADRLKLIRGWGDVEHNFTADEKAAVVKEHKEMLAWHRKRKDWQAWV